MKMKNLIKKTCIVTLLVALNALAVFSQSTGFTYQGRLNDNNLPANGNYDFEFRLFDALTGGSQQGTPRQFPNVTVTNGTFTILLDLGAGAFPGADRFLEIGVRPSGSGGNFTTLTPRQQVTLTPYAIKSVSATQADFAINANSAQSAINATNASQLGGVAANQFVQTNDSRLTDARPPLPGSTNYIQNSTQASSGNFNISGNGTVGGTFIGDIINASTHFSLSGSRVIHGTGTNLFVGKTTAVSNTTGIQNAFFGNGAGASNTTGNSNTFLGRNAANSNTTGNNNTIIGDEADVGSNDLNNASAIGQRAFVERSNAIVLGGVNGKNGATSDTNVGIGTTSPNTTLDIETEKSLPNIQPDIRVTNFGRFPYFSFRSSRGVRNGPTATTSDDILLLIGVDGYTGSSFTNAGAASIYFFPTENWNTVANGTKISFFTTANGSTSPGQRMTINHDGNIGIGPGTVNNTPAQRLDVNGNIRVGPLSTNLGCIEDRDGTVIAGSCSSDARFKRDIESFGSVLNSFSKLRPVNFFWRKDEFPDKYFGDKQSFGLIAQEVEQIFPDLVSTDELGFKVVNYSKLPLLTIQAVKELKSENDSLKRQLQRQQAQIDELKKLFFRKPTKVKKRKVKKGIKK